MENPIFDELSFQIFLNSQKSKIVFFLTSYIFSKRVQVILRQKADFFEFEQIVFYILFHEKP